MWRTAFLYLSTSQAMRRFVADNWVARRIASRFVAGESPEDAVDAALHLNRRGAAVEIDYLGENVLDVSQAAAATDSYFYLLERLSAAGVEGHISVKLSQMGLDLGDDLCFANVDALVARADGVGNFVWFDMEGADYTERTISMYEKVRAARANVGIALQAYLYRTRADARYVLSIGGTVRLCKGAYSEPASVAYPSKLDVDRNFAALEESLLCSRRYQAIATHDEGMIRHAIRFAEANSVDKRAFEFQMLYGVRRDLQDSLLEAGYRLRVYVPFGGEWYPYLMRRLAERPANLIFLLRSLAGEGVRPRPAASQPAVAQESNDVPGEQAPSGR